MDVNKQRERLVGAAPIYKMSFFQVFSLLLGAACIVQIFDELMVASLMGDLPRRGIMSSRYSS